MMQKDQLIIIISAFILLVGSVFSTGYFHFDEHFQILELAGLKLNLTSVSELPWEYSHQLRAAIQPLMVVCFHKLVSLFGIGNPFTIALLLRILSSILGLYTCFLFYKLYKTKIQTPYLKHCFLILSYLSWFFIFSGVRFSAENWSGALFAIGFAWYFLKVRKTNLHYLGIGIILGLSFLCRYQVGFLIAGFFSWILFIDKVKARPLLLMGGGLLMMLILGVLVDYWYYDEWTFTIWNYISELFLKKGEHQFESDAWWWYFYNISTQFMPPFGVFFILALIVFVFSKPKNPVSWTLLPFIFIHLLVGHKELRFFIPILHFMPFVLIKAIEILKQKYIQDLFTNKIFKTGINVFFIVNFVLLIAVMVIPADNYISLYKSIYTNYKTPTTLYFVDKNPYLRVYNINFYKRKNLSIEKLNTIDDLSLDAKNKELLVVTDTKKIENLQIKHKLIYSSFPKWVENFNFNNWIERTNRFYVYELQGE